MLGQVVRHAADHVGAALQQVDASVLVEIHRQAPQVARHELRHADGAGKTAAHLLRVEPPLLAQQQELLELVAEERRAVAPTAGKVEGEGGERIDDAEVAHLPSVDRLHADDPDDDLGWHAIAPLRFGEPLLVLVPELASGAQPHRLHEAVAVRIPVLRSAGRRRHHESGNHRLVACACQLLAHPGGIESVPRSQLIGKPLHILAAAVDHIVGCRVGASRRRSRRRGRCSCLGGLACRCRLGLSGRLARCLGGLGRAWRLRALVLGRCGVCRTWMQKRSGCSGKRCTGQHSGKSRRAVLHGCGIVSRCAAIDAARGHRVQAVDRARARTSLRTRRVSDGSGRWRAAGP